MNFQEIADEALRLGPEERARLAQELLLSLEAEEQTEVEAQWLDEAARRARELDEGTVTPVSAEEVRVKVAALLR